MSTTSTDRAGGRKPSVGMLDLAGAALADWYRTWPWWAAPLVVLAAGLSAHVAPLFAVSVIVGVAFVAGAHRPARIARSWWGVLSGAVLVSIPLAPVELIEPWPNDLIGPYGAASWPPRLPGGVQDWWYLLTFHGAAIGAGAYVLGGVEGTRRRSLALIACVVLSLVSMRVWFVALHDGGGSGILGLLALSPRAWEVREVAAWAPGLALACGLLCPRGRARSLGWLLMIGWLLWSLSSRLGSEFLGGASSVFPAALVVLVAACTGDALRATAPQVPAAGALLARLQRWPWQTSFRVVLVCWLVLLLPASLLEDAQVSGFLQAALAGAAVSAATATHLVWGCRTTWGRAAPYAAAVLVPTLPLACLQWAGVVRSQSLVALFLSVAAVGVVSTALAGPLARRLDPRSPSTAVVVMVAVLAAVLTQPVEISFGHTGEHFTFGIGWAVAAAAAFHLLVRHAFHTRGWIAGALALGLFTGIGATVFGASARAGDWRTLRSDGFGGGRGMDGTQDWTLLLPIWALFWLLCGLAAVLSAKARSLTAVPADHAIFTDFDTPEA